MSHRLLLLLLLSACAGPSLHTTPANGSASSPSQPEVKRSVVGSTLGPADPLAAPNCGLPTVPGDCPEETAPEQKPQPHQHHHGAAAPEPNLDSAVAETKVVDPNCKMSIDPKTASGGTLTLEGKQYWFCSTSCRRAFEAKNPGAK